MLAADDAATAAPLSLGFVWRVGREATWHTEGPWNPPCGTLPVEPSLFAIWWPQHPTVADQDGIEKWCVVRMSLDRSPLRPVF